MAPYHFGRMKMARASEFTSSNGSLAKRWQAHLLITDTSYHKMAMEKHCVARKAAKPDRFSFTFNR